MAQQKIFVSTEYVDPSKTRREKRRESWLLRRKCARKKGKNSRDTDKMRRRLRLLLTRKFKERRIKMKHGREARWRVGGGREGRSEE